MFRKPYFQISATLVLFVLTASQQFVFAYDDHDKLAPIVNSDYYENGAPNPEKVLLGKLMFFEKELSGNRNISCATCHHALTATGDGLSLPVGEGGRGLGVTRDTGVGTDEIIGRVPRNAPPIFNLGAIQFDKLFHDGRVQTDDSQLSGFATPADNELPLTLDNVLAAQAMFPVTSGTEMAGQAGENSIADAAVIGNLSGTGGVWEQLADRLKAIPTYVDKFKKAFADINSADDITYAHAANAIAAFESVAWRADRSPFDRYLRGENGAMSNSAKKGMKLFYGDAGCANCHSGVFQTDQIFHAIAMPQIGPGKGHGADGDEDFGRQAVTGYDADIYKFRTPSLRNVELTGPWGHDGAFNSLVQIVKHHFDAQSSIHNYDISQAVLPSHSDLDAQDFTVQMDHTKRDAIASASELSTNIEIHPKHLVFLLDFLRALTDPRSLDLRKDVPTELYSGLHLAE